MNIGLYFGSFNPVHVGHLIIASFVRYECDLEKVWLVVSPQNPFKPSKTLLNEYHRLHLVRLAVEGDPNLEVSEIEFKLPKPSYTIDTVAYLEEKYPQHTFSIIIGSDSFQNILKWKNGQLLVDRFPLFVYLRPGFPVNTDRANIKILKAPLLEISATEIRKMIKEGKSPRYFLPDAVREEIEANRYYK